MQRSMCVSVFRDVGDPDVFQYRAVSIANLDVNRTALGMCIYIQQLAGIFFTVASDWCRSSMDYCIIVLVHIRPYALKLFAD